MDLLTIVTFAGVAGVVSKGLTVLLERVSTKKHQSITIESILLRENVSYEELHQRVDELAKDQCIDSNERNRTVD
jgi:hypothetical protein